MESQINIQLVHGGFIFTSQAEDSGYKTEVFTSQGKLMKAIRTAIDANSLVAKEKPAAKDGAVDTSDVE